MTRFRFCTPHEPRAAPALVALLIAVAMPGCATFTPAPIEPATLLRSFEARTLDGAEVQAYVAAHRGQARAATPIRTWDLATLTLAAFYFSPELDVARARSTTIGAAQQTAARRPNPSLQIPFIYTGNPKPGESPYTLGLGLDIPIETAGKRGYRIDQARQRSIAARLDVGNVAWQVRSRLRTHLLDLYAARRRAAVLERLVQARRQVVEMLDKRLAVGAASAPQASLARTALDQGRLDLARTAQQIVDAQAAAAATIGLPLAALARAVIRLDAFEVVDPALPDATARAQAVLNRADVVSALAGYEASQSALQLEIANQYPDIHIGPGYTYDAGAHKFALSLGGIALPVFDRNQGPIAEAEARRAEAAARLDALQARAAGAAEGAAQNYRATLASLGLAQGLLAAQQRQRTATLEAFRAGAQDRLALTLGEAEFLAATLAHQDAMLQLQRSIGRLEDAMQAPLTAAAAPAAPAPAPAAALPE